MEYVIRSFRDEKNNAVPFFVSGTVHLTNFERFSLSLAHAARQNRSLALFHFCNVVFLSSPLSACEVGGKVFFLPPCISQSNGNIVTLILFQRPGFLSPFFVVVVST